jgi:hypothetical protein
MEKRNMNKQVKRYFDWKFENGELDTKPYSDDNKTKWTGIWIDDFLIVGAPADDKVNRPWFTNSSYFQGGDELFNMSPSEFHDEMLKYIKQKYPDVMISSII